MPVAPTNIALIVSIAAILWICLLTFVTYAVYATDKRAAQLGAWRVPESTLIFLGFAGGTIGALIAMRRLRHKTSKTSFQAKFVFATILQLIIVTGAVVYRNKISAKVHTAVTGSPARPRDILIIGATPATGKKHPPRRSTPAPYY